MVMSTDSHSPSEIQEILRLKNVAVVGMSNTDGKPANFVPKYLLENGYCWKTLHGLASTIIQFGCWMKCYPFKPKNLGQKVTV
jgi:hypothetical protein